MATSYDFVQLDVFTRTPLAATDGTRVCIFTTREELPFAGHPTLGTALYLYSTTNTAHDEIALDLNVGKILVRFTAGSTRRTRPETIFSSGRH